MSEKYILSHDVGTGGTKASLINLEEKIINSSFEEYELYHPQESWAEQKPNEWWNAVIKTTREVLDKTKIPSNAIEAISFSVQMVGTLPVDELGNPVRNAIIWLDARAKKEPDEIMEKIDLNTIFEITGLLPGPKDIISKIVWFMNHEPRLYEKAHKIIDSKDFLIHKCTNKFITDQSCASVSVLFDTRKDKLKWSEEICNAINLPIDKLSKIMKSTDIVGELTEKAANELNLRSGTSVINGAGDAACAAIGSGAIRENKPHIYIGSSGWITAHISKRDASLEYFIGSICSANPSHYLLISEQESAGACYKWFQTELGNNQTYQELDKIASESVPGANSLIFLPWIYGERSPILDDKVRGGFINLSLTHKRKDFVRSVMEGVVYNTRWALQGIEKLCGSVTEINVIGGGVKSPVWCQIFADVLNKKVRVPNEPLHAGAKGAALLALIGLDFCKNFEELEKLIKIEKVYSPNEANLTVYNSIFKQFTKIYKKMSGIFHKLNE